MRKVKCRTQYAERYLGTVGNMRKAQICHVSGILITVCASCIIWAYHFPSVFNARFITAKQHIASDIRYRHFTHSRWKVRGRV